LKDGLSDDQSKSRTDKKSREKFDPTSFFFGNDSPFVILPGSLFNSSYLCVRERESESERGREREREREGERGVGSVNVSCCQAASSSHRSCVREKWGGQTMMCQTAFNSRYLVGGAGHHFVERWDISTQLWWLAPGEVCW
jgi:hypothetical protein